LSSIGTYVEIDETIVCRTLCEGAEKIRVAVLPFFGADWEFEPQILFRKSLLLDGLVIAPVTFLNADINTTWRSLDDHTKRNLSFHAASITSAASKPVKFSESSLQPNP
jgi:hypothetical protein